MCLNGIVIRLIRHALTPKLLLHDLQGDTYTWAMNCDTRIHIYERMAEISALLNV